MNEQINKGDTLQKLRFAVNANTEKLNKIPDNFSTNVVSSAMTLAVASWVANTQVVSYEHDVNMRNSIDVNGDSLTEWSRCGIKATSETESSITFTCDELPSFDLSFVVTSTPIG